MNIVWQIKGSLKLEHNYVAEVNQMKLDLDSCMQHINGHVTNQVQNNTAEREKC